MITDKLPFLAPLDVSKMLIIDIFLNQNKKIRRRKIRLKIGSLLPKMEELAAMCK